MRGQPALDGDLRSHLHHTSGRDLEEVRGVAGGFGETDEELVLPERHARMRCGPDRAAGQEERRRHDVELEALLAQKRETPWNIRRLHVAVAQLNAPERGADL